MPDPSRPLCLYHKNCLDGAAAAAVVALLHPNAECIPVQYGTKAPRTEGRLVYVVDFGFPLEHMRALRAQAKEVVWIDHHSSQIATQRTLGWGTVDITDCAASLVWKTLFPGKDEPRIISFIRDKDLWQWKLPDSRAIAAGLSQSFANSRFAGILDADLESMRRLGEPLLIEQAARVAKIVATGVAIPEPYGIVGRRALVVECKFDLNDLGDHICTPCERGGMGFDLAIMYNPKLPSSWIHSLRSNGEVNCALIAEQRGGGGHLSSACYVSSQAFLSSADCPGPYRRTVTTK